MSVRIVPPAKPEDDRERRLSRRIDSTEERLETLESEMEIVKGEEASTRRRVGEHGFRLYLTEKRQRRLEAAVAVAILAAGVAGYVYGKRNDETEAARIDTPTPEPPRKSGDLIAAPF